MEIGITSAARWVLLTGATGFVGQCLLGELLDRGHRVLAIVRADTPAEARHRLADAMKPWGREIERHLESGQLAVLRGDLHEPGLGVSAGIVGRLHGAIVSLVHAAGNTTFRTTPDGAPGRTNVEGTREAFRFARRCECVDWHLISTAYVCGKARSAIEQPLPHAPEFRNDYERSKWIAERESAQSAAEAGAALTVYRPSIVVGDSRSGVATRFVGIYYLIRGTSLVERAVTQHEDVDRHRIPLRICADPAAGTNLVFADDAARDFADVFDRREARGGVYHLTHPAPPNNEQIKRALERYYNISGGRFVGREAQLPAAGRSTYEEIFSGMTDSIANYLFDSPVFDRNRIQAHLSRCATAWTVDRFHRLVQHAESVGWHQTAVDRDPHAELDGFAAYFERFLPENALRSKMSRIGELCVDVRFQIDEGRDGDWLCRFDCGKVVDVRRSDANAGHVTFRTRPKAFWRAVAGDVTGAELFLSGDARIEGDVERGLKFALILEEFVREFPCDREKLLATAT